MTLNEQFKQKINNLEEQLKKQELLHQTEILDYKNAIANLTDKIKAFSQSSEISVIKITFKLIDYHIIIIFSILLYTFYLLYFSSLK